MSGKHRVAAKSRELEVSALPKQDRSPERHSLRGIVDLVPPKQPSSILLILEWCLQAQLNTAFQAPIMAVQTAPAEAGKLVYGSLRLLGRRFADHDLSHGEADADWPKLTLPRQGGLIYRKADMTGILLWCRPILLRASAWAEARFSCGTASRREIWHRHI